eukprot:1218336-Rhodomonas_salina.1
MISKSLCPVASLSACGQHPSLADSKSQDSQATHCARATSRPRVGINMLKGNMIQSGHKVRWPFPRPSIRLSPECLAYNSQCFAMFKTSSRCLKRNRDVLFQLAGTVTYIGVFIPSIMIPIIGLRGAALRNPSCKPALRGVSLVRPQRLTATPSFLAPGALSTRVQGRV